MKKISLVVLILLVGFALFADGLNDNAQYLKDTHPDIYEAIKTRAIGEWDNDHTMILYIINQQSTAIRECSRLVLEYKLIVETQMVAWCDGDAYSYDEIYEAPVDWTMVLYVSKMQIKAQGSY